LALINRYEEKAPHSTQSLQAALKNTLSKLPALYQFFRDTQANDDFITTLNDWLDSIGQNNFDNATTITKDITLKYKNLTSDFKLFLKYFQTCAKSYSQS
jgi:hypothetical protein